MIRPRSRLGGGCWPAAAAAGGRSGGGGRVAAGGAQGRSSQSACHSALQDHRQPFPGPGAPSSKPCTSASCNTSSRVTSSSRRFCRLHAAAAAMAGGPEDAVRPAPGRDSRAGAPAGCGASADCAGVVGGMCGSTMHLCPFRRCAAAGSASCCIDASGSGQAPTSVRLQCFSATTSYLFHLLPAFARGILHGHPRLHC